MIGEAIKAYFSIVGGAEKRRMDKALSAPYETSCSTLRDILTYNKDTVYGK